jgi:adenosylmethionine-8-amino-7-oxononanoate aminotransferase
MRHARPKISHGEGLYLFDESGKRYIDGSGGPLVVNVGHGRPEIVAAMSEQARTAAYVHAAMFTSEAVEEYSTALAAVVPIPAARFFYMTSGSETVEGAIKLARQIQMARGEQSRSLIISRAFSYHGTSLGALSVSGKAALRVPYLGMMSHMPRIRPPYPYRFPASGVELASRLEEAILAYGPENVAAFIAEPISGATLGAVVPPDEYWPRIRQICDAYGVLLIADEVLVGMGRTGTWWGLDHWHISPDILVTSKGAASGYFPLGLLAARGSDVDQIQQSLGDFNHGGTFSHHAVGAAAGLATLRILQTEQLVENAAVMGAYLGQQLQQALGDHPHVGDIRGCGLFWGIEFVADRHTRAPFPASRRLAWHVWERAFELGLIVYYSQGCVDGTHGDVVMLGPPLIVNAAHIDEIVALCTAAITAELG